jgi:hypothetical protein
MYMGSFYSGENFLGTPTIYFPCNYLKVFVIQSHMGLSFVIGAKENLGPFPLLRPKVLAPNLCHVDCHVECEEIWVGPPM